MAYFSNPHINKTNNTPPAVIFSPSLKSQVGLEENFWHFAIFFHWGFVVIIVLWYQLQADWFLRALLQPESWQFLSKCSPELEISVLHYDDQDDFLCQEKNK